MLWIGLTGGIASGKSTVSAELARRGAPVVDADVLARRVVEPGSEGLAELVASFGSSILAQDGSLHRATLGALVFSDPASRARVNAILHPRIAALALAERERARLAGHAWAVYDVPLLVENALYREMDAVIVVVCGREQQLARLMARNALSRTQAEARVAAQLDDAARCAHATWVVDNGGSLASTHEQVERLVQQLDAMARARSR
ncbi:MAG: dephospho-CoA kinase [Myxococcota bacterium]|jgi:dephospho-CoA kinase|nr:dephospho-CoA kinase [Myxococcota bacterium]